MIINVYRSKRNRIKQIEQDQHEKKKRVKMVWSAGPCPAGGGLLLSFSLCLLIVSWRSLASSSPLASINDLGVFREFCKKSRELCI